MIQNGKYIYPSFKRLIPKLIETFVEYYGESNRPYITKRMHEVDVYFFTGFDSISDYVERRMPASRDVVMEEMLADLKVEEKNKKAVREAMFTSMLSGKKNKTLAMGDYSRLAVAALCNVEGFETSFKPHEVTRILGYRDAICKAFGLNTKNDAIKNKFIKDLGRDEFSM